MSSHELIDPPFEPYRAATTIPAGLSQLPPLPAGVRRGLYNHPTSIDSVPLERHNTRRLLCRDNLIVLRDTPIKTRLSNERSKPTATVVPTTLTPSSSPRPNSPPSSASISTVGTQTDDLEIDLDLLFHVEDMMRTQKTLAVPVGRFGNGSGDRGSQVCSTASKTEVSVSPSDPSTLISQLQEALVMQRKVNTDLKRLLVSALAGNSDLANELVDLTSDNVNLSGRSRDLAAQKAMLTEVADTAGIAADVWRAKCLAGRVLATEAARRLTRANQQVQLTRFALAHLLGERARLRCELGTAVALLCSRNQTAGVSVPSPKDTIGLAALCHQLVFSGHFSEKEKEGEKSDLPVLCQADTPGEDLALRVLTNNMSCPNSNQPIATSELQCLVPPLLPTEIDDTIQKALQSFASTHFVQLDNPIACPSTCRGCKGTITTI